MNQITVITHVAMNVYHISLNGRMIVGPLNSKADAMEHALTVQRTLRQLGKTSKMEFENW